MIIMMIIIMIFMIVIIIFVEVAMMKTMMIGRPSKLSEIDLYCGKKLSELVPPPGIDPSRFTQSSCYALLTRRARR